MEEADAGTQFPEVGPASARKCMWAVESTLDSGVDWAHKDGGCSLGMNAVMHYTQGGSMWEDFQDSNCNDRRRINQVNPKGLYRILL